MKTPFQHFIQLAQRVLEATNPLNNYSDRPTSAISYIVKDHTVEFGDFTTHCRVQIYKHDNGTVRASCEFYSPVDYDCDGFDELFIEWTKNVDDFLASDSMILIDNQIKANLRK